MRTEDSDRPCLVLSSEMDDGRTLGPGMGEGGCGDSGFSSGDLSMGDWDVL